jgi:hypothetical protein
MMQDRRRWNAMYTSTAMTNSNTYTDVFHRLLEPAAQAPRRPSKSSTIVVFITTSHLLCQWSLRIRLDEKLEAR